MLSTSPHKLKRRVNAPLRVGGRPAGQVFDKKNGLTALSCQAVAIQEIAYAKTLMTDLSIVSLGTKPTI